MHSFFAHKFVVAVTLLACGSLSVPTESLADIPNLDTWYASLRWADDRANREDREIMAQAQRELENQLPSPGLKVGDKAPPFSLPNARGERVFLYEMLQKGPVVLVFYRGEWCPYCNLQLYALKQSHGEIERLGATVLAVTPQTQDFSRKQIERDQLPFEILADLRGSVMKHYDVYYELPDALKKLHLERLHFDLADYNGSGRYVLPVPATFVIDRDGVVRRAHASTDYTRRMEPSDIVAALRDLKQ
jgi:peroxiredoxin